MNIKIKPKKLTTRKRLVWRGLKQPLRLAADNNAVADDDRVIGVCPDCGALLYADEDATIDPLPTDQPVDEWEYFM